MCLATSNGSEDKISSPLYLQRRVQAESQDIIKLKGQRRQTFYLSLWSYRDDMYVDFWVFAFLRGIVRTSQWVSGRIDYADAFVVAIDAQRQKKLSPR